MCYLRNWASDSLSVDQLGCCCRAVHKTPHRTSRSKGVRAVHPLLSISLISLPLSDLARLIVHLVCTLFLRRFLNLGPFSPVHSFSYSIIITAVKTFLLSFSFGCSLLYYHDCLLYTLSIGVRPLKWPYESPLYICNIFITRVVDGNLDC